MLSFDEARRKVIEVTRALEYRSARETIALGQSSLRVLAATVLADRDYPPFDRSTRDGFAVRAAEASAAGATLACIGESRAGAGFTGALAAGQCVEIMTGAPVPAGTDAVVMLEYVRLANGLATFDRAAERGQNSTVVARGTRRPALAVCWRAPRYRRTCPRSPGGMPRRRSFCAAARRRHLHRR